jgi:hypothetical protein
VDSKPGDKKRRKKLNKPTEREITPAYLFLRALQMGLSYEAAFFTEVGFINDLMIEKSNDSYDYAVKGNTRDIDLLFGG